MKQKKVVMIGLGILGGGTSTARWLINHGHFVYIWDDKDQTQLASSIKQLPKKGWKFLKNKTELKQCIQSSRFVVVNPAVPLSHFAVAYAIKNGKTLENEATLFLKATRKPIVAVTGTRGKTTTTNWIAHFLRTKATGNSQVNPFLKAIKQDQQTRQYAVELSSFVLEHFNPHTPAPHIAVITNIYQDHLNRHGSLRKYAKTKFNIFAGQTAQDYAVLNANNLYIKNTVPKNLKSQVFYFSVKPLKKYQKGLFVQSGWVTSNQTGKHLHLMPAKQFIEKWGEHNLENLLASLLSANLAGISYPRLLRLLPTLPQIPYRQETIYKKGSLEIINDTTATSPEGNLVALKRFGKRPGSMFIIGGTNRNLDFKPWAKQVKHLVRPKQLIFFAGSATNLMLKELGQWTKHPKIFKTLAGCIAEALDTRRNSCVIVFTPGAKSFGSFTNEYERGESFAREVGKWIRSHRLTSNSFHNHPTQT